MENEDDHAYPSDLVETPSKGGRGRPKGIKTKSNLGENISTPRKASDGRSLFSTPVKPNEDLQKNGLSSSHYNADRSARRKSVRILIERTMTDEVSENDDNEIARRIYESYDEDSGIEEKDQNDDNILEPKGTPTTPSKKGRGRPKGSKNRKRTPTPPLDLPPHELYFSQNRGGGMKTSNNTLSSLALLDHEEYFALSRKYQDPHRDDIEFLKDLHTRSFNQWRFELSQGFNICVYGWGSKRSLLMTFAEHIYKSQTNHERDKIIVINGYVHNVTIRDIFNTIAGAMSDHPQKLGSQPAEMLENLYRILEGDESRRITLVIHSVDGIPLRRSATQNLLARLASHHQINLIASADHPSFPLLWDSSLRSTYNFLFHDCTTFAPYTMEVDVVNEVHELLGRSGRRVGGKEGVSFVLKSLPQNAKKLFQVLVAEQLAAMGEEYGVGNDEDAFDNSNRKRLNGNQKRTEQGVEYRLLYQKAVEDFICGDEVSFRTLLKE
jgi:origin recognition complex subunit 2